MSATFDQFDFRFQSQFKFFVKLFSGHYNCFVLIQALFVSSEIQIKAVGFMIQFNLQFSSRDGIKAFVSTKKLPNQITSNAEVQCIFATSFITGNNNS